MNTAKFLRTTILKNVWTSANGCFWSGKIFKLWLDWDLGKEKRPHDFRNLWTIKAFFQMLCNVFKGDQKGSLGRNRLERKGFIDKCKNIILVRPRKYYVKSVHIRSYSGPHFPVFGLNMERYGVSVHIQSECGNIWTGITPNMETFYVVKLL